MDHTKVVGLQQMFLLEGVLNVVGTDGRTYKFEGTVSKPSLVDVFADLAVTTRMMPKGGMAYDVNYSKILQDIRLTQDQCNYLLSFVRGELPPAELTRESLVAKFESLTK